MPAAFSPAGMISSTFTTGPRAILAISSIAKWGAIAVTATTCALASNSSLATELRYFPSLALSPALTQARTVPTSAWLRTSSSGFFSDAYRKKI